MSLYTIQQETREILEKYLSSFDSESGEIFDENLFLETKKELAEQENKANESLENVLKYRANISWDIASIESEIKRLSEIKAMLTRKESTLWKYIERFFRTLYDGKNQIIGNFQLWFRSSTAVNITNEAGLPKEYLRVIPESTAPDKKAIWEALKDWKEVAWAELEKRKNFFIK